MFEVYLSDDRMKHQDLVLKLLNDLSLYNPNFGNQDFSIKEDMHTWILCDDEVLGTKVLRQIEDMFEEIENR